MPEVWRIALDPRLGLSFGAVEAMTVQQIHQALAIQAMLDEQAMRIEAMRQQDAALKRMGR